MCYDYLFTSSVFVPVCSPAMSSATKLLKI